MSTLNLHLTILKERGQSQPRHWILMFAEENATHAIFHHVTGGPMHSKPYEVVIEPKHVESHGIEKRYLIAKVLEKDRQEVKAAVRQAPPLFCDGAPSKKSSGDGDATNA
ncbi:hypothetical protein QSH57_015928 [Fusarium oxysporum f. sp. vasinfectum]|nr:hypothetical protein QSH57_015928 [Fusarium oxysporum f. sp. vasinfectum]